MKQHGVSVDDLANAKFDELLRQNRSLGGHARAANLSKERLSEIGRMGAAARHDKLSNRRRSQIARKAAKARWAVGGGVEKGS